MNIFDHLYYLAFSFYKKWGDFDSEFASVVVLSAIQYFNIFSLIILLGLFIPKIPFWDKTYVIGVAMLVLVLNYFRYFKQKPIADIKAYIAQHPEVEKRKIFVLIYFWGSIIVTVIILTVKKMMG